MGITLLYSLIFHRALPVRARLVVFYKYYEILRTYCVFYVLGNRAVNLNRSQHQERDVLLYKSMLR